MRTVGTSNMSSGVEHGQWNLFRVSGEEWVSNGKKLEASVAMGSVPVVPRPLARAVTREVDAERLGLRSWLCQNLGLRPVGIPG